MAPFAVALVNYRSADLTAACVEACRPAGPAEICVVENGSGDGSAARLRGLKGVTLVERAQNKGFAAGVNAAFAATSTPVVVLLNPDARPRPGALERLVAHLEAHPRAGVAAPRLFNADGTPQSSAYRRQPGLGTICAELCVPLAVLQDLVPALDRYRLPPQAWSPGARASHVIGAALAIRRSAFEAAGPFDEGFFLYLEETEWQARVTTAGWTVELVPDAEVDHLVRGGEGAELGPSVHYVPSARRFLLRQGHRPRAVSLSLDAALLGSRLGARLWDRFPGAQHTRGARVQAWDAVWRRRHDRYHPRPSGG